MRHSHLKCPAFLPSLIHLFILILIRAKNQRMKSIKNQKKPPLISVVIPTFNRAHMLKDALDSVFAQDFKDFELIVVDDGSTDDTESVLEKYKGRLAVIRQQNSGVSTARNRGIAFSSGQRVAFLDSDDMWLPGKLSAQAAFFKNRPDALICQTDEIWIRNGKRVNPKNRHKKESGDVFKRSLDLCLVSPSAVMMDRRLFDDFGVFDETLPACEDYDLWLRIGSRHPVGLIHEPLVIKRGGHDDQLSKIPVLDKYRIASIIKLLESGLLSDGQRDSAILVLKKKCVIFSNGCRKRGRISEADHYADLSRHYTPSR